DYGIFLKGASGWGARPIIQKSCVGKPCLSHSICHSPPAAERHQRPYSFHDSEGPRSLQKSIDGGHDAGAGKCQDEPVASMLQGIGDEHRGNRNQAENRECAHTLPLAIDGLLLWLFMVLEQAHNSRRAMLWLSQRMLRAVLVICA